MSAFSDHMERVQKCAPAPEDAVRPALILQKRDRLEKELGRLLVARKSPPADMWTEYALIREDQPDLELFLADWCAMYVPPAALRRALEIVASEQEEAWLLAQHSDTERRSENGPIRIGVAPDMDWPKPVVRMDGTEESILSTSAPSAGSSTSGGTDNTPD